MWAAASAPDGASTETAVIEGLRAWARGIYPTEAAVELLGRSFGGRLLRGPWVATDGDGWYWIEPGALIDAGYLSGGELRVLRLAVSLISDAWPVSLGDVLPGLDLAEVRLVLAAVAHAAGSHEASELVPDPAGPILMHDGSRAGFKVAGSLYPWPGTSAADAVTAATEGASS